MDILEHGSRRKKMEVVYFLVGLVLGVATGWIVGYFWGKSKKKVSEVLERASKQ